MNSVVCLSPLISLPTTVPSCFTQDFFFNIIQQYEPGVMLKQVVVGLPRSYDNVFKSELFQADLYYFDASGTSKLKVVIIRIIVTEEMFDKEIDLWFRLLPKFELILLEAGDIVKFTPDCYLYQIYPLKLIVYEHLTYTGYQSLFCYPDLWQLELPIVKIAKWHAVSYKLALEEPSLFKNFLNGCLTRPPFTFETQSLECFIITLGKFPKLRKFQQYFVELSCKNFLQEVEDLFLEYRDNKQPDIYYGLCHGDFNFRNLMFKGYQDARFIECQSSYMGPLVHDIIYALNVSLGNFNLKYAQDELICFYFQTFLKTLNDINFTGEKPKLADLRKQIIKNKKYEFYIIYTYLPIWIKVFSKNPVDLQRALTDREYLPIIYEDPKYIENLEVILPRFLYLGYFDD